jgi:hypothetical protein
MGGLGGRILEFAWGELQMISACAQGSAWSSGVEGDGI